MMVREFILLVFLCIYLPGCQDTGHMIVDTKGPTHEVQINGEIQFHGEILWSASNDSLNTKITAENIGTGTASIETGPCAFNIIANNENSDPVWYNRPPDKYVCPDELIVYRIAPKETKELTDQMYISGKNWFWDIPDGDWHFVIESRTKSGKSISFTVDETKIN